MEILGVRFGLTLSDQTLRNQIAASGFDVTKVKFDKKRDRYLATAKNDRGLEIERAGKTERLALSNLLLACTRRNGRNSMRLSSWSTTFTDQVQAIAEAYAKAPIYDPKASSAFMELARDCERRATVLREHLQIQIVNNPEPYPKAQKLVDDIRKKRRLIVSRAGIDHPIWSKDQVIAYRICHDVLGYAAADAGWDWQGENMAFAAHVALLPAIAQKALFTESIASAAYATTFRAYGPQKVTLFPAFMDRAQKDEGHQAHPGVHPDTSYPPMPVPTAKDDTVSHIVLGSLLDGLDRRHAAPQYIDPSRLMDPNAGWQSGEEPITTNTGQTLKEAYGDPLQTDLVRDNAAKMIPQYNGTEWAKLNQDDPAELQKMKEAIVNAFRAVLLSPRKDLMWNTIHYQDLRSVPANESDPAAYWNALENSRQDWNEARGYDRFSHVPYMKYLPAFINIMVQRNYEAGYDIGLEKAKRTLMEWHTYYEDQLMAEDEDKPEGKRRAGFQIEARVNTLIGKKLKTIIAESKPDLDKAVTYQVKRQLKETPEDVGSLRAASYADPWADDPKTIDRSKYGAFMGSHVKAIAQIGRYADQILQAALQDVHEHDGTGHHFRSVVLQLGMPGVGPKVCSFAWLMLQPMTSQLATIDTHILDTLGMNEKQYNNRDYFGMERTLRARADAAGYQDMPLGQVQWGLWDYKRTGPGSHQDHSGLKALDPMSHETVDWSSKQQPINAEQAVLHKQQWQSEQIPYAEWWYHTKPAGDDAWDDWQETMSPGVAKKNIPYSNLPTDYGPNVYTRTSSIIVRPWYIHPATGQRITGQPGQTIMEHVMQETGLTPVQVWAQFGDDQVGKDRASDIGGPLATWSSAQL